MELEKKGMASIRHDCRLTWALGRTQQPKLVRKGQLHNHKSGATRNFYTLCNHWVGHADVEPWIGGVTPALPFTVTTRKSEEGLKMMSEAVFAGPAGGLLWFNEGDKARGCLSRTVKPA